MRNFDCSRVAMVPGQRRRGSVMARKYQRGIDRSISRPAEALLLVAKIPHEVSEDIDQRRGI